MSLSPGPLTFCYAAICKSPVGPGVHGDNAPPFSDNFSGHWHQTSGHFLSLPGPGPYKIRIVDFLRFFFQEFDQIAQCLTDRFQIEKIGFAPELFRPHLFDDVFLFHHLGNRTELRQRLRGADHAPDRLRRVFPLQFGQLDRIHEQLIIDYLFRTLYR